MGFEVHLIGTRFRIKEQSSSRTMKGSDSIKELCPSGRTISHPPVAGFQQSLGSAHCLAFNMQPRSTLNLLAFLTSAQPYYWGQLALASGGVRSPAGDEDIPQVRRFSVWGGIPDFEFSFGASEVFKLYGSGLEIQGFVFLSYVSGQALRRSV